jgi:hypothetical protein
MFQRDQSPFRVGLSVLCPSLLSPEVPLFACLGPSEPSNQFNDVVGKVQVVVEQDYFQYAESPKGGEHPQIEWYLNFADHQLFRYYGGTFTPLAH